MADTKISDLSAKTVPVAADTIAIVDSTDTSSKKCTFAQLLTGGTAWTIGKTSVNCAFAGTMTIAEGLTITTGGAEITAGGLTVTDGGATIVAGGFTVSDGTTSLTDNSNAGATLIIQNDTATTFGNGTTEDAGVVVFSSDSLTTGTLLRLQLDESALNGGHFIDCVQTDGPNSVWKIAENGITTIAGTAGSNSLILTAGDVSIADGSITVTDADQAASLSVTNNTATTASVFVFAGSGVFTGSTTTSFMTITASGLTTGTAVYLPVAAVTEGKALHVVAGTTLTTGQAIVVSTASTALTSGQLLNVDYTVSGETIGNKSGQLVDITASIDYTKASGTVAGDFDLVSIIKTSTNTTAGGTHTETGSVLYIGNVVTQTAGTMTDTTVGVEILMDAQGTGDGIKITHPAVTGKAIEIISSATTAAGVILATADALTTGQILKLASAATAITTDGRMFLSSHTGTTSTSGVLNEFISAATDGTVIVKITASAALAAGAALEISAAAVTTGNALKIEGADALVSGDLVSLESDSADTTARALLKAHNNNAAASGATCLEVINDSTGAPVTSTGAAQSSHFFKFATANSVTIWISDGTTANAALAATTGDICLNAGSNKPEYCTNGAGSAWTALV